MKNQYFGDVNDYRKYGLIRTLGDSLGGRTLVSWMMTPDDGSLDGRLRGYLDTPNPWRRHDPVLYDGLRDILSSSIQLSVEPLERSSLLPNTSFHGQLVPDGREARSSWADEMIGRAEGSELVFLDPDNGIEIPSCPTGRKRSSKYAMWREIDSIWRLGSSILIYQHFPREERSRFVRRLLGELQHRTEASTVQAFRTANVVFLLAAQGRHSSALSQVNRQLMTNWAGQVTPLTSTAAIGQE